MNVDGSSKLLASGATNVEAAVVGGVMKRMDDTPITDNAHSDIFKEGDYVPPNMEALASIAAANDGGVAAEQDSKKGPTEAPGGRGGTKDEFSARNDVISASVAEVPRVAAACTSDSGDDYDRKYHDFKEDTPEPHPPCDTTELVDDKAVNPTFVSAEVSVGATGSSSAGYNTHDVDHEVQKHAPTPPQFFVAGDLEGGRENDKSSHRTDPKRSTLDSGAAGGVGNSIGRNGEPQSQSRPIEEQSMPGQPKKRRKRPQRAGARPRGWREVHREDRHPPSSLILQEGGPSAAQVLEMEVYLDEDQIGARLFAELNDYKTQASREREHNDFYNRYYWEAPSSSESDSEEAEGEPEEEAGGDESGDGTDGGKESGTSLSADNDGGIGAAVSTENPAMEEARGMAECTNQYYSAPPSILTKAQPSDRRRSIRKASTMATTRIAGGGGGQQHEGSSSSSDKGGNKNVRERKNGERNNRRFTRRMARDLDQEIANLGLSALVAAMLEMEEEEGEGKDGTSRPVGDMKPRRLKRGRSGHGNAKGTSHSSSATASDSTSSRKNNNATSKTAEGGRQRRGNKTSKARSSTRAPRDVKPTTRLGQKRKHRVIEKEANVDIDGKDKTKRRRRQVSISSPPCCPPPSPEPRKRRRVTTLPKKESGTAGLFCGSSIAMAKEAKDRILAATFHTSTTADTQESEQEERGAGTTTSSDDGCVGGALVAWDGGPGTPPPRVETPSAATAMASSVSRPSKSATPRRFLVALLKREAANNGTGEEALGPLTPRDGDDTSARVRAANAASDADSTHLHVADGPLSEGKTKRPSTKSGRSPIAARVTRIIVNGKSLLLPLEHDGRRCRRGKNMKSKPDAVVDSKSKVIPQKTQAQCASPESVTDGVGVKPPLFSEAPLEPTSSVLTPPHLPSTPARMAELHGKRTPYATHHPLWHGTLFHCIRSGGRRFARHEFFYSDIDQAWFKRNEYVIDLAKFGIPPNAKLTRSEWRAVRQLLPHRPKRFSPRFVSSQLKKLHCYRDQVRDVQRAAIAGATADLPCDRVLWGGSSKIAQRVPMPIRVGTTVTAYSRQAQMIQRGIVMGRDYHRNTYIVQFDCKELRYEVCPDFEVARQFQVSTIDHVKGVLAVDCVGSNPADGSPDMKKQAVVGNEKRMGASMSSIGEASMPVPPTLSRCNHSVNSSTQPWTTLGPKVSTPCPIARMKVIHAFT